MGVISAWRSECFNMFIWGFPYMGVGTPKSSIFIRFSLINHPFWGTPIYGNPHLVYPIPGKSALTCSNPSPSVKSVPNGPSPSSCACWSYVYNCIHNHIDTVYSMYTYLSIYLSVYLSIYPSIYPSIYLAIYLSGYVSIYLINQSINLSIYLSIYLSVHLSSYLSL